MTKKERIAKLEKEVAELKARIATLELRPWITTPIVPPQPYVPTYPLPAPYVGERTPGDPIPQWGQTFSFATTTDCRR